jgi:hypothetical protein
MVPAGSGTEVKKLMYRKLEINNCKGIDISLKN